ncbi:tetratricopeptide repeat protein [Lentzea sp. NBRC 102530]|uniref:tetratricopeptide repeat protein n=1 Tax=Lentzea sp. NBRC 102530 TaxID=3032201 RepID=UPI0024A5BECF|nr:tetratricopeptide repeat protein [Lentzea sp. NBRC 102530]GLY51137.1 hypothetical protein Lesp01_47930 [Lentzea sp. NBRC 102530]
MINPVTRGETWHRPARTGYPDPVKMLGYVWPVVEDLRATPRAEWPSPDALAEALAEQAEYFEEAGWDDFALRTHLEVLEFRRESGDAGKLREVLTPLRANLMRQQRYEEALPVAVEELEVAWQVAVPGDYSTERANVARYWVTDLLGKLGRHEEAARNAAAAIEELRDQGPIEHASPPGYRLAHAHSEHADRLEVLGEFERAADARAESVTIWRLHAADSPLNCYLELEELSRLQLRLGRFEESRATAVESVEVLRRGAEGDDWHLKTLHAGAVHNHGNRLHALGLDEEAVAAAQDAVTCYRTLAAQAERRAVAMKMELHVSLALVSLGSRLHDVRRLDEALAASDEALEIASRYDDRELGRKELARAWHNRASLLLSFGSWPDAVEAAAKGVELYQRTEDKAMARNTFALASARCGALDEALEASLSSVADYREWAARDPYTYTRLLADALTDHAIIRSLRSERAEAEGAIGESLVLHQELAAAHPGRCQRELDRARSVADHLPAR